MTAGPGCPAGTQDGHAAPFPVDVLLSIAPSTLFWALTCGEKETERGKRQEAILSNKFRGTDSTLERPRCLVHGGICLLWGAFPIG